MIDIAQLREALARILDNFQMSSEVGIPIVRESEWEIAFAAAKEILALREAGALIITPDEAEISHRGIRKGRRYTAYRVYDDALRDAMPPEDAE